MAKVAVIKTKETDSNVEEYIGKLKNEQQQKDSLALIKLMQKVSKEKPKLWGSSIIGFGNKRYKSPTSGREVDWFKIGFAPRKANISLYLMLNLQTHDQTLSQMGKHKTGAGCVYINKLSDIDMKVLEALLVASLRE